MLTEAYLPTSLYSIHLQYALHKLLQQQEKVTQFNHLVSVCLVWTYPHNPNPFEEWPVLKTRETGHARASRDKGGLGVRSSNNGGNNNANSNKHQGNNKQHNKNPHKARRDTEE